MKPRLSQTVQHWAAYLFHRPRTLALVAFSLVMTMAPAFVSTRPAYANQFFTSGPFTVTITRTDGEWKHFNYASFETLGALAAVYYTVSQPKAMGQGGCQPWVSDCPDSSHSAWIATSSMWLDSSVAYCEYHDTYGRSACDFVSNSWASPNFGYGLNTYAPGTPVYGEWFLGCSLGSECPGGTETVTVTFTLVWYGTPPTPVVTATTTATLTETLTPTLTPTATLTPSATLRASPSATPTPTPTGPTPTRTHTPTPTRTPTRTATPAKPPRYSSSYYISLWDSAESKLDTAALQELGRTEAISETAKGVTDAIVVLHFGYPYRKGNDYGADVLVLTEERLFFASMEDIRKGAMAFVKAYCLNSSPTIYLTLALGVNDSVQNIGSGHGQAWASMVEEVSKAIRNDDTLCRPPWRTFPRVSIAGAMDIEPASLITQSVPIDVLQWAEAYSNTTRLPYYNFGTCSNCPADSPEQSHTLPSVSPLMDDVWTVSWGIPNARPLPQIYNVNQFNANQWYNLNRYAATCTAPCRPSQSHKRRMYFSGTFTQYQSCDRKRKPKTCIQADNSPEEGWRQLFDALNANPITRQVSLRWSTDIAWRTSEP